MELIIVVVILAILAGIGFVTYASNLSGARDSTRRSDMSRLKIALKAERQNSLKYPLPGDAFRIVHSGSANPVANQGFMNQKVATNAISEYPSDPRSLKPYAYSTFKEGLAFQIAMTMEEGGGRAYVDGDYKSVSVNVLPSIVLAVSTPAGSSVEIADGVVTAWSDGSSNRKKFVLDGGTANLPYGKDGIPVANSVMAFAQIQSQSGVSLNGTPSFRSCPEIIDAGMWIGIAEYQLLSSDGTVRNVICLGDGSEKAATGGGSVSGCPTPTTPAQSYPGCDTADIVLPNGQRWAACNVGATTAYSGQSVSFADSAATGGPTAAQKAYMGAYYQWGRNIDVTTGGTVSGPLDAATAASETRFIATPSSPFDWIAPQDDNLWGGVGSTTSTGTFVSLWSPAAMRGPCAAWYHVPTQKEWCDAIVAVSPTQSAGTAIPCDGGRYVEATANKFITTLKLPIAGARFYLSAMFAYQGANGLYWAASATGAHAGNVDLSPTLGVSPASKALRANGLPVRCLADEACTPTPVDGVCGSANGTASTSAPSSNLCASGTASAVAGSGPWSWTCSGTNGGASASCSTLFTTTYPGCDTADIVLSNGQRWAACNVGATTAYAGQAYPLAGSPPNSAQKGYLGGFFQWGRNDDVTALPSVSGPTAAAGSYFYTGSTNPYDWIALQNGNLWGGSGSTSTGWTFASLGSPSSMAGPCAAGYHVPTSKEWCDALMAVSPTQSGGTAMVCGTAWYYESVPNAFRSALKLPLAGSRNFSTAGYSAQGSFGYYWASSPLKYVGYETFDGSSLFFLTVDKVSMSAGTPRANGLSVRCLRN